MAPRIVFRPTQGAAVGLEAVPGTRTVQRAWQAARPGPATSEPSTRGMSGHRRGTTDSVGETPPRPTSPAPPLPAATVSGGGPSAPGAVSAETQAGWAAADVDRLIEALEERVLAEIERRGGRYTGVF